MVIVEPRRPFLAIEISGYFPTSCPLNFHCILIGRSPFGTVH